MTPGQLRVESMEKDIESLTESVQILLKMIENDGILIGRTIEALDRLTTFLVDKE